MALSLEQAKDYLKRSKFSDFNVVCGDDTFRVHKVILYAKSPFFARCIDGGFKETEEATLTLRDKKRLVVAHMLLFAYMGDEAIVRSVHDTWPFLKQDAVEATGKEPMQWAQLHYVDLYELATFLMFEELQEFAKRTIIQLQDYDWEEFRCDDRHVDGAEISSAARVLRYIYTRIPVEGGGLRAEITANCVKNWGNVDGCQEIIDVVTEFEPVAWQVGVTFRKR